MDRQRQEEGISDSEEDDYEDFDSPGGAGQEDSEEGEELDIQTLDLFMRDSRI